MNSSLAKYLQVALVAWGAMVAPAVRAADVVVSSIPVWNGSDNTGITFGTPSTRTMGETFTNTSGYTALTSVAFNVRNNTAAAFQVTTFVYAWTGTSTTGSALFTSAPITILGNGTSSGYQSISTSTGNVPLAAGGQYVAFASIGSSASGINASWAQASGGGSSFFGGQYVRTNNPVSPGSSWTVGNTVSAFTMTFAPASPVPEPSTLALAACAAGLTARASFLRRRKALRAAHAPVDRRDA